jgi:group I intron endonuclease
MIRDIVAASDFNKSGIYKIENLITNDFYIGSAICFRTRFNAHNSKLKNNKHHNKHLYNAVLKYGQDNFKFTIIEFCGKDALLTVEQKHLDELNPVYNKQKLAGIWRAVERPDYKGGFKKGYIMSEEHKQAKKLANIRMKADPNYVDPRIGRKHSPATITKMKISRAQREINKLLQSPR